MGGREIPHEKDYHRPDSVAYLLRGGLWRSGLGSFWETASDVEILNDIDQELINFFRIIRDRPEDFIESFDLELVSRAEFDRLAALDPGQIDDIERAHRFYYLIMAGWGGELNYPRF